MRHNMLSRGMGQVGNHHSMSRTHAKNNQVCRPLSRDFQNPLCRGSELVAESDHAFYMTP